MYKCFALAAASPAYNKPTLPNVEFWILKKNMSLSDFETQKLIRRLRVIVALLKCHCCWSHFRRNNHLQSSLFGYISPSGSRVGRHREWTRTDGIGFPFVLIVERYDGRHSRLVKFYRIRIIPVGQRSLTHFAPSALESVMQYWVVRYRQKIEQVTQNSLDRCLNAIMKPIWLASEQGS